MLKHKVILNLNRKETFDSKNVVDELLCCLEYDAYTNFREEVIFFIVRVMKENGGSKPFLNVGIYCYSVINTCTHFVTMTVIF